MRITKTQIDKYLSLRSEIKEREEAMKTLRDRLIAFLKETGEERVETPSGSVQLVYRKTLILDEEKVKKALGVDSLDRFKESRISESLVVHA